MPADPLIGGDTIAFYGAGSSGQQGIYKSTGGGAPVTVADTGTAIPSGAGTFSLFRSISMDDANLAIIGGNSAGLLGIYGSLSGGALIRLVDNTMTLPGSSSRFADFLAVSIDPADFAFLATGSDGEKGIFASLSGTLFDVINRGDVLDGRTISDLSFGKAGFFEDANGAQIAYRATFTDGTSGTYTSAVVVPEPGSLALLGMAGLLLAGRRRARSRHSALGSDDR